MTNEQQVDLFGEVKSIKPPVERGLLTKQLQSILGAYTLENFVGLLTNEFEEIIQYAGLSNNENACQKTSLLFNPHRLNTRTKSSKSSLYDAIRDDSFMSGLARATLWKNKKVSELLYQVIQLGINGIQYVNEFPPHIARNIYREFGLSKESKILDPCAGWGGRMIGTSVVSDYYDCFEPCVETYNGLIRLAEFIAKLNTSFNPRINNIPFEDAVLTDGYYDFALTSPPYYDTEIYSDEPTNSMNRYATFNAWCDGFYIPLINKTMQSIKHNGVFLLNIGNRNYPLNDILVNACSGKYIVEKKGNYLSGNAGLGRDGEGEMFYSIRWL